MYTNNTQTEVGWHPGSAMHSSLVSCGPKLCFNLWHERVMRNCINLW